MCILAVNIDTVGGHNFEEGRQNEVKQDGYQKVIPKNVLLDFRTILNFCILNQMYCILHFVLEPANRKVLHPVWEERADIQEATYQKCLN